METQKKQPAEEPAATQSWAMLVYMAGDNNLTEEMVWGLQQLEHTLETKPKIGEAVRVVALYDARGLNPCEFDLNPPKRDGVRAASGNLDKPDGNLDKKKKKKEEEEEEEEEGPRVSHEVFEKVKTLLEPTPEHRAAAILHILHARDDLHARDNQQMKNCIAVVKNHFEKGAEAEAEDFVNLLMTLDEAEISSPEDRDEAARMLVESFLSRRGPRSAVLAESKDYTNEKTAREDTEARDHVKELLDVRKDFIKSNSDQIEKLAKFIAESPDSVFRNTRDLSSPLMIQAFIEGQIEQLKEEKKERMYVVVLSGHGGGATGDFLPDEDPKSALTIPRLGEMLKKARKKLREDYCFPILGMDSCLMSMAEVGYEVQDSVLFMVGAEGFVPNAGWPYHRVLEALAESKAEGDAAENIVKKYAAFYQDYELGGLSTHLAAIDLAKIGTPDQKLLAQWKAKAEANVEDAKAFIALAEKGTPDQGLLDQWKARVKAKAKDAKPFFDRLKDDGNLATAIRLLADNLIEALKGLDAGAESTELGQDPPALSEGRQVRDALILAHWYAQSFMFEKYVDLWDFCDQLRRFLPNEGKGLLIRECCDAVKVRIEGIKGAVVRSCYCGPEFQHAHGISVFFPWSRQDFSIEYGNLKFAQDTRWFEFLDIYLEKTERRRRPHDARVGAEPFRLESDWEQVIHKTGSHVSTRVASHVSTRVASHVSTRVASHVSTRMEGGKQVLQTNVKNAPDGYFRQDNVNGEKGEFTDKHGKDVRSE